MSFVKTDEFSVRLTKINSRTSLELTAYLCEFELFELSGMTILSKARKPNKFEPYNSLKLSFMNIRGLCSNFVECESFLESNSLDILAPCETNLDDSNDSGNFSARGYVPLIQKDSVTYRLCEGLPFVRYLSTDADSYLCFRLCVRFLMLLHLI